MLITQTNQTKLIKSFDLDEKSHKF